jgi:hypothetical protein
MKESKEWILPSCLVFVALIFLIAAVFLPWWSIKLASEAELVVNASARIDYTVTQTVTASKSTENKTFTGSFSDLTSNQADKDALTSLFNATLILVMVGLVLTIITLVFVFVPKLRSRLFAYTSITTFVAGILLFIAVVNLAFRMPLQVSKLLQLAHPDFKLPPSWVSINPSDIGDFWGSKKIPSAAEFPSWVQGGDFWVWGPSIGWYLTFVAALLLIMSAAIVYAMLRAMKSSLEAKSYIESEVTHQESSDGS